MLQESKAVLQEGREMLQESVAKPQEGGDIPQELQEHDPQPNLWSYYKFYEGGKLIPTEFTVLILHELDKERSRSHRWMKIEKSKGVEDVGLMEERIKSMGEGNYYLRLIEANMRKQLRIENKRLKEQLQEKEGRLATMESLVMEAIK